MKKCPKCEAINSLDREYCFKCEASFVENPKVVKNKIPENKPRRRHKRKHEEEKEPEIVTRGLSYLSLSIISTYVLIIFIQAKLSIWIPFTAVYIFCSMGFFILYELKLNVKEENKGNEIKKPIESFFLLLASIFFFCIGIAILFFILLPSKNIKFMYSIVN
ncbi:hypothetical protein KAJ27_06545 [bacterium]|nr:hypothetical protein [bacterium]